MAFSLHNYDGAALAHTGGPQFQHGRHAADARGMNPSIQQKNHVSALILASGLGKWLSTFADEHTTEA